MSNCGYEVTPETTAERRSLRIAASRLLLRDRAEIGARTRRRSRPPRLRASTSALEADVIFGDRLHANESMVRLEAVS